MKPSSRNMMVSILKIQEILDEMMSVAKTLNNRAATRLANSAIECMQKMEHYTLEAIRAEEELCALVVENTPYPGNGMAIGETAVHKPVSDRITRI